MDKESLIAAIMFGKQYGSPLVVSAAADMTNTDRVYVYTGSETGYTNGNWYYWNGTAWTSGGVYNAAFPYPTNDGDYTLHIEDGQITWTKGTVFMTAD